MRQSFKFNNNTKDYKDLKDPHSFSLSFRDKKISKFTKSLLESNYSTRITESDNQLTDSYINCSKTPNLLIKRPQQSELDLLVNPSKGYVIEQDNNFKLTDNSFKFYLEDNNNKNKKSTVSNFQLVSNLDYKNNDNKQIDNNLINNNNLYNQYSTDSGLGYQNSFKEHIAEETHNIVERNIKILFTIYISQGLIQQVTGESKEKYSNPIIIKELMTVMSTENFIPIIKRFITMVNCHLEVYNLRLLSLADAVKMINGENVKLEDQTVYLPKYMKSSGKPDYDLPGFDLKTPIDLFKLDKFALGFDPQCLTCIKGKSSKYKSGINKPVIDYISENDSDEESSSMENSHKNNYGYLKNLNNYNIIGSEPIKKVDGSSFSNENDSKAINQNAVSKVADVSSVEKKNKGCCDFCLVF
jgi:hypothetical protein